jgi:molecular chaperone DnaK (HSP70)
LDTLHAYTTLSSKQISESTRVLGDFEKAERARRDHEAASNGLESLVYDTAVKLEEEWLARKDFVTDFKAIDQEVKELKTWMEDNIAGADVQTLRKKRDKLAGLIRAVHQKERKQKEDKLKVRWFLVVQK